MSDDLISRKAVIDLIESCHVFEDAYCLVDYINELPAAYDVDKVVEQLEECAIIELGITKEKFEMDRGEYSSYCALSLTETKEIVKSGCIE